MTTLSFDKITEALKAQGIPAYTEQTGGGTATIMVGELYPVERPVIEWRDGAPIDKGTYTEERYSVLVGPGWFDGPGWSDPKGDSADLYVGPDDDGESDFYTVGEGTTEAEVVAEVVRQYRGEG